MCFWHAFVVFCIVFCGSIVDSVVHLFVNILISGYVFWQEHNILLSKIAPSKELKS